MSSFISFSKIKRGHKYIIFASIFAFLTNYIFGYVYNDDLDLFILISTGIHKKLSCHIVYHYIFRFLGIFIFSLLFYQRERNNSKIENPLIKNKNESKDIELIYTNIEEDVKDKANVTFLLIFIVISIMVFQNLLEDIYRGSNLRGLKLWMLELIIVSYFNYLILKIKIKRHHYLAIIINSLFLVYKIIYIYIFINTCNKNDIYCKYSENKWLIPIGIIFYFIYMVTKAYAITKT